MVVSIRPSQSAQQMRRRPKLRHLTERPANVQTSDIRHLFTEATVSQSPPKSPESLQTEADSSQKQAEKDACRRLLELQRRACEQLRQRWACSGCPLEAARLRSIPSLQKRARSARPPRGNAAENVLSRYRVMPPIVDAMQQLSRCNPLGQRITANEWEQQQRGMPNKHPQTNVEQPQTGTTARLERMSLIPPISRELDTDPQSECRPPSGVYDGRPGVNCRGSNTPEVESCGVHPDGSSSAREPPSFSTCQRLSERVDVPPATSEGKRLRAKIVVTVKRLVQQSKAGQARGVVDTWQSSSSNVSPRFGHPSRERTAAPSA